jgi:hypothetical protein
MIEGRIGTANFARVLARCDDRGAQPQVCRIGGACG